MSFVCADPATSRLLLDQHHILIDVFGGRLVLAPVDLSRPNLKILDSATADGHWLQELREQCIHLSKHEYVGTDINPKSLPKAYPSDCVFYTHNFAEAWPAAEHSTFDLVHQRLSLPGAAPHPLPQAVRNLFELVKPGGWIQLVEAEQTAHDSGPVYTDFMGLVKEFFDAIGVGWKYPENIRQWLEEAGAVDIQEISVDLAIGATNKRKEFIEFGAKSCSEAAAGIVMHAKGMGLSTTLRDDQLDTLCDRLYRELVEIGGHKTIRAIWGRKRNVGEV